MRVLRDPDLACMIEDEALRALVAQRFVEIAQDEPYDPDVYGYFIVLEPGDSVAALEKEVGWPILGSVFNRPLKKSVQVRKMVISGVPHPLPTLEKSLVGCPERSAFGSASFLRTFSTAC